MTKKSQNLCAVDQIHGGFADYGDPKDFPADQIEKGVKVEREHTNDDSLAKEIAMDHLKEFPNYYDALDEMEKKLKADKKESREEKDASDDVVDSMRDNLGHQQGGQTAATVDGGYWADNIFYANNFDNNTYPPTTRARRSFLNKLVKSQSNHLSDLRKLAKELRFHGLDDVCDNVVLAIFAETNARDARPDLSYSFIVRQLRKFDPERAREFQEHFKKAFDEAFLSGIDNVDDAALMQTIQEIELNQEELSAKEEHKASREYRLYKLAQDSLSGDVAVAGRHIANIVKFLLGRISYVNRYQSMLKLREKIWNLDEYDIASKKSPPTASLGQSITFIKTLLNGKDPGYIRSILSEIVKNLI